jgi:hypothetical protein
LDFYICLGSTPEHLWALALSARRRGTVPWTIASTARVGDDCFFYIIEPLGAFVARGRLRSAASKQLAKREGLPNYYVAEIGSIQLLERPIPLRRVRDAIRWGWLDQPRMSARVPENVVTALLAMLT